MKNLFLSALLLFSFQAPPQLNIVEVTNPYCGKTKDDFPMPPVSCPEFKIDSACADICYELIYWKNLVLAYNRACNEWNAGYAIFDNCIDQAISEWVQCINNSETPSQFSLCDNILKNKLYMCQAQWDLKQAQILFDIAQVTLDTTMSFYECIDHTCCFGQL